MDRTLKKWEISLIFGLLLTMTLGCWLGEEQRELAGQVVRLHVIANSDSAEDQRVKLAVRDGVLARAEELYRDVESREEALELLSQYLPALEQAGAEAARLAGSGQPVTARVEDCWFPTKVYDSFALPAGEYTALRVVIGEGAGQNWWCVAYPPLCLGAASETMEEAVLAGAFSQEQADLMTGGYVLKFKSLELLGELKGWLNEIIL